MVEKGLVFDILRSSLHDGPGIRTAVFLKGCPLNCVWCHNPESKSYNKELFIYYDKCILCGRCQNICKYDVHRIFNAQHEIDYQACTFCGECVDACLQSALKIVGQWMTVDEIIEEVLKDKAFYDNSSGGITITGGEPMAQFAFIKSCLVRSKQEGLNTCLDTCGFAPKEQLMELFDFVDHFLFDYKIESSSEHKLYTGVSNRRILENLDLLYESGQMITLRCPIIPGINDTHPHFASIKRLDDKYPNLNGIELLTYHNLGNSKSISIGMSTALTNIKPITSDQSERYLEILHELGCHKAKIG